ncbi:SH3 domain-containing protein [Smittium culicis]|uniref:SH3 domain-containing protein n=1 Tax=Smittium culicis TaxID=133412 RepID=A0A1R1YH51_9FUNG|nr:SH3 domain-containing protein [Smittium culicis]
MKISTRKINNILPFIPTSLENDVSKSSEILLSVERQTHLDFLKYKIPANILETCHGLVILSVLKGGFLYSGRVGSGIVVARLPNGSWSGPSAVGMIGLGIGGQIGAEITNLIIALNSPEDIDSFSSNKALLVGTNITVSSPAIGRNIEADVNLLKGLTVFSYSHSRGLFAGISLEGTLIVERKSANKKYYNRKITAKEILTSDRITSEISNKQNLSKLYFSIQLRNDRTIADYKKYLASAERNVLPDYQASSSSDCYQDVKNSNETVRDTKIDDKDTKVDIRPETEYLSFNRDQAAPELPPRKKN